MTRAIASRSSIGSSLRSTFQPTLVALGCLVLVLGLSGPSAAVAQESGEDNLVVLGELPTPSSDVRVGGFTIEAVDSENRRMYGRYLNGQDFLTHLIEYDLEPDVPRAVRDVALPDETVVGGNFGGEYRTAIDTQRDRLIVVGSDGDVGAVDVIDLGSLDVVDHWSFGTTLPGFVPRGAVYDAEADRVYFVGIFSSSTIDSITNSLGVIGKAPTVVALEADGGGLAWVRQVPECQRVLQVFGSGALIARSSLEPVLYFPCANAETRSSGVVAMQIGPDATQADAAVSRVNFHPVPGRYQGGTISITGAARFDPLTDRVFFQSLSASTPGAFVFDGRLDAWVGFIAARGLPFYSGLNSGNGRFYMGGDGEGGSDEFLDSADGRATPLSQGVTDRDTVPSGHIVGLPGSDRIILLDEQQGAYLVVDDRTPNIDASATVDYDALTDDVPEGPGTRTFFSGSASGFGAATSLVGGYENALVNAAVVPLIGVPTSNAAGNVAQEIGLSFGNRGVVTGDVENLDVGSFDIAANARALSADRATSSDQQDLSTETSVPLDDPYSDAHCGEPEDETGGTDPFEFGEARVSCDRQAGAGTAHSSFDPGYKVEGGDVELALGSSSFDTSLHRDEDLGLVSQNVAVARDIVVSSPQGSVSVGEVRATARTAAQGRSGTALARWTRVLSGVTVRDADGEVLFGPVSCVTVIDGSEGDGEGEPSGMGTDSCQQLIEQIQQTPLQTRFKLGLPLPSLESTPQGAFAQVREAQADFLEGRALNGDDRTVVPAATLTVFMDGQTKSRLFTELAALRSNSIYYVQQFVSFGGDTGPGLDFDSRGSELGGELSPPTLDGPKLGGDEALVSQLSNFLANVDPSQLAGPPLAASDPQAPPMEGEPSQPTGSFDTGDEFGSAPPADMGLAPGLDLGSGEVGGEPAPVAAAPAEPPTDDFGSGGQPAGPLGTSVLARSVVDAALVGGIWLLFLGAMVLVMRRSSLLQLLRP